KTILREQGENLRKMFFALARDLRPIFILLARNWEQMKNIQSLSPEQQRRQAQGALEILSPLAYSLGMLEAKGQLEDLAFPILYPKEHSWLLGNITQQYEERQKYLDKLTPKLPPLFQKERIKTLDIHKRAKHYFSLYQKLLRHDMDLSRIYDLVALRIIVQNIEDCYKALGTLHKIWPPLPGRIKDYISQPKLNGYRSLHTTVLAPDNIITEFQIKTLQMHQEAEFGAAAHLSYKNQPNAPAYKHQFYWMEKIRQLQEEAKNHSKAIQFLQTDFLKGQIFVLTPRGDIINLPKDSTPIDFAYAIHSTLGDHCEVAKVDGKIISLKTPLQTGQTVEIITNKRQRPSENWLRFVKSKKAQDKIRKFLQKETGGQAQKPKIIERLSKQLSQGFDELTEKVELIKKYIPLSLKRREPRVLIGGQADISFKLGKCCEPKPGNDIAAFITQGEGATVHKTACRNFQLLRKKWPERIVEANWS
ncbi:MAG: TGS domain-containing protein, partial [Candidatus Pacebacteria bacterium]|nr:TGS domain-containing protein [Candidatus Paceibacterota bacterium]